MKRFLFILLGLCIVCAASAQTNRKIKSLQNRRRIIQREIVQRERILRSTKQDVSHQLQSLNTLNGQIDERKKYIYIIGSDVRTIAGETENLKSQLSDLQNELNNKKRQYAKSLRYISRHKTVEDKLMFVFSANSLSQAYRRLRYVKQYGDYQKKLAYGIISQQQRIIKKRNELEEVRREKTNLLNEGIQQKQQLETQEQDKRTLIGSLQSKQKDLQVEIGSKKKKAQQMNSQIDQLIAIEVEATRKRAEMEAHRKATQVAAARAIAAKRAAARAAASKAAAERAAIARVAAEKAAAERTIAAKAAREKALAARNATERASAEKAAKEQAEAAREAEEHVKETKAVEKKATEVATKEHEEATNVPAEKYELDSYDRAASNSFESSRGRLPMPITGTYMVINHYGHYSVRGLHNVQLDNKGIDIQGQAGAMARAIYDGEVVFVFQMNGLSNIIVRHGAYLSVYCNLSSVSVGRGQHVHSRQSLGRVYSDPSDGNRTVLHFQLRHETAKLNPEAWLGR